MKALVTGGAGLIGSFVVDELVDRGATVVTLDNLSTGFLENVNPGSIFIRGDITDTKLLREIFNRFNFDYVYHIAAYAAEGLSHFIKRFNYEVNLIGSVNLINEAIRVGCKCFVFTSSMAVYGSGDVPFVEDQVLHPEDSYAIAKVAVEQELRVSKEVFGLNYIIFRPHNVIGERQCIWDRYRNVVGIFISEALDNKPITVYGDGKQKRAFSNIRDVAPVIATSVFNDKLYNDVFNIGGDEVITINELAKMVLKITGSKSKIAHLPQRYEVKVAYPSQEKLKKRIRYKAKFSTEQGIEQMVEWAKSQRKTRSVFAPSLEITKNLPSYWTK